MILAKRICSNDAVALSVRNDGDDRSGDSKPSAAPHLAKELGNQDPSSRDKVRDRCYDPLTRDQSATRLAKSTQSD